MIELFGFLLIIAGSVLLVFAWRGRLVCTHPHCRGCGFDLDGLPLEQTRNCPECGRKIRRGTAAIRVGKRKRRGRILVLAALVIMMGACGVGWKPLARATGFDRVDWFTYFPESMLLRLEAAGNTEAFNELHDRLIPGDVTGEGLALLVDRALDRYESARSEPDPRWGDVILYALLTGNITQEQITRFGELYILAQTEVQESVPDDADRVWVQLSYWDREGMSGSFQFYADWVRSLHNPEGAFGSEHSPLTFEMRYHRISVNHDSDAAVFHTKRSEHWIPSSGVSGSWRLSQRLSTEEDEFTITAKRSFRILNGDLVLGGWSVTQSRFGRRTPVNHSFVAPILDVNTAAEQAKHVLIDRITIPTQIEEAKTHTRTARYRKSLFVLRFTEGFTSGVLGDCWLRAGKHELEVGPVAFARYTSSSADQAIGVRPPMRDLEFFEEHTQFWSTAAELGKVDIVIRPTGVGWEEHPAIRSYLADEIIFRGVPIECLVPVKYSRNPDGSEREVWYWNPGPEFIKYDWVTGVTLRTSE